MSSIPLPPRNYQIGVCFVCQLCMYCGKNLTLENCACDKDVKPTKHNRSKVAYFRNLVYKPGVKIPEITKSTLLQSNHKYGYKLNMDLPHNFTFCSACNSQINRDAKAVGKEQSKIIEISSPSPTDGASSQIEFRLRMSIKQNKQAYPSVIANFTLENPSFISFRSKLETYICEQVGLVYQNEYNLAYKSSSESGVGTLLDNEEAFDEFLRDYQIMTMGNKKAIIIVKLKESSKKHSRQVFIVYCFRGYLLSKLLSF